MSEIEKLYENAEIEKHITCDHANCPQYGAFGRDKCAVKTRIPTEECIKNKEYTTAEYVYPPFTAKKQLELIKWLCKYTYRNYFTIHFYSREFLWGCQSNFSQGDITDTFEDALASLINHMWRSFTPEEQAEIKEILND